MEGAEERVCLWGCRRLLDLLSGRRMRFRTSSDAWSPDPFELLSRFSSITVNDRLGAKLRGLRTTTVDADCSERIPNRPRDFRGADGAGITKDRY